MSAHLDDFLSAYADHELTAEEEARAETHLAVCPACRGELAFTRQAKSWLSGLPEVLPPLGFYERMLLDPSGPRERRDRWTLRIGALSLAATASVWLAVVGLSGLDSSRPSGIPALNSLVSLHESTPPGDRPPAGDRGPDVELAHRAASLGLPPAIAGYQLDSVVDRGAEQQATYTDGVQAMSVFVLLRFDIAESRLPRGSQGTVIGGHPAWIVPREPNPLILAQVGANAIVVVGPEPAAPGMTEGVEPTSSSRSILDRVQGAGEGLLEAFGLG